MFCKNTKIKNNVVNFVFFNSQNDEKCGFFLLLLKFYFILNQYYKCVI